MTFIQNVSNIGIPGQLGFGVGICQDQEALVRLNLQPMEGCDDPTSDNYGNYIHTPTQSVMVYIPAFKYRIGDLPEGELAIERLLTKFVESRFLNASRVNMPF